MVRFYAPPLLVPKILVTQFQFQEGLSDEAIWKPNDNGAFSCSSAWEVIRQRNTKNRINNQIWHKYIPFKVSFLLWRAIRLKLPTNETLVKFGVEPRSCSCCRRPGMDTINHILVEGHFSNYIWRIFASSIGQIHVPMPLPNLLLKWWNLGYNNEAHKLLLHAIPIFICWGLWKNRCPALYGGKQSTIKRVNFQICKDIYLLLHIAYPYISWPSNWKELVQCV